MRIAKLDISNRNSCNLRWNKHQFHVLREKFPCILAIWMIRCNKPWALPEDVYCGFVSFVFFIFCFEQKIQGPRKRQRVIASPDRRKASPAPVSPSQPQSDRAMAACSERFKMQSHPVRGCVTFCTLCYKCHSPLLCFHSIRPSPFKINA